MFLATRLDSLSVATNTGNSYMLPTGTCFASFNGCIFLVIHGKQTHLGVPCLSGWIDLALSVRRREVTASHHPKDIDRIATSLATILGHAPDPDAFLVALNSQDKLVRSEAVECLGLISRIQTEKRSSIYAVDSVYGARTGKSEKIHHDDEFTDFWVS